MVRLGGEVIADTTSSFRVLETSHPPTYYLPRSSFADGVLEPVAGSSMCEFKGRAAYLTLRSERASAPRAAWYYPTPQPGFEQLADHIALYPGMVDSCEIDGETVLAQDGDFYGGWITSRVVGPFKGAAGTLGW